MDDEDESDIRGLYDILPDADAPCVAAAFAAASSRPLPNVNVNIGLLTQPLSEVADATVAAVALGGMRVSRDGSVVVRTSTVFCRVCHDKALPLGGAGGSKIKGYRYAYHCPSCHNSWSQIRPEDIPAGGDAAFRDSCKKKPKLGKCSCVAVGKAVAPPQQHIDARVADALSFADAVTFMAGVVAGPVAVAVELADDAAVETEVTVLSQPVSSHPPISASSAAAVPNEWLHSKKRVRTGVDGMVKTYTGADAYRVLKMFSYERQR